MEFEIKSTLQMFMLFTTETNKRTENHQRYSLVLRLSVLVLRLLKDKRSGLGRGLKDKVLFISLVKKSRERNFAVTYYVLQTEHTSLLALWDRHCILSHICT